MTLIGILCLPSSRGCWISRETIDVENHRHWSKLSFSLAADRTLRRTLRGLQHPVSDDHQKVPSVLAVQLRSRLYFPGPNAGELIVVAGKSRITQKWSLYGQDQ